MDDNRTHANLSIKSPFLLLAFLVCVGAILAEALYYHLFGMQGFLVFFLGLNVTSDDGAWNDERKLVWIIGAGWGAAMASIFLLRREVR